VSSAVEQRFCKPLVGSSNLSPGTTRSARRGRSTRRTGAFGEDAMVCKSQAARALSVSSLVLPLAALTACSGGMGLWSSEEKPPEPNLYPEKYKSDLVAYVRGSPGDMLNVRDAAVSAPALRQFGSESRYFVCLRTVGQDGRKDKLVVFFAGRINQFV